MNFQEKITNYVRAAFPCIAVQTTEEPRCLGDILAVAKAMNRAAIVWSATEGARQVLPQVKEFPDTQDLDAAARIRQQDCIFVLRDPHTWPVDRDAQLCRRMRDLMQTAPQAGMTVIVLAPEYRPHPTYERLVTVLDYALPDAADLKKIAEGIARSAQGAKGKKQAAKLDITDAVVRALGGLSTHEAENALALSIVETGGFDDAVVYREKVLAVKRSGLLEVIESDKRGLDAIGGMANAKEWMKIRKLAYTPEAAAFGLPDPKGILCVGVPGGGKSLLAKVVGTVLDMPTLKLDFGAMFNSLVGESEARMRAALALAEAMSPCVIFIDEIEKGLAGSSGSGSGDSGVGKRVLGTFLTWMQERKRSVFVIASANSVEFLPPELLRKGRWDEIFAVDLPDLEEREAILNIHLRARKRDPNSFDVKAACEAMSSFTGSEIEAVVVEALFNAFFQGRELETADMVQAAQRTVPLATTCKEQVNAIREWAKTRARFAGSGASGIPIEDAGPRRRIIGMAALMEEDAPATKDDTEKAKGN